MQKLTKKFVKSLIMEIMDSEEVEELETTKGTHRKFKVGEEIHQVPNDKVPQFLKNYSPSRIQKITKEQIDRIIREEVKFFYGA